MLWTLFGAVVVVSHCIVVVNIKVSSDSNLSKNANVLLQRDLQRDKMWTRNQQMRFSLCGNEI